MPDRLALVIANSKYQDPELHDLTSPHHDAEAMAEVLADPDIGGFELTVLEDESLAKVTREIANLYSNRSRDDTLLLYFSGHGVRDDHNDLFLAVHDTEKDLLNGTAISAQFVTDMLDKSMSRRDIMIVDCCHSGAFADGAKGELSPAAAAFEGNGYGRVILTSSNSVQFSWEGQGVDDESQRSMFTKFIVDGLQSGAADLSGSGTVSADELYEFAYDQLLAIDARQTPQRLARSEGELIVAHNPRPVAPRPASYKLSDEILAAAHSNLAGVREGSVTELARLLKDPRDQVARRAHDELGTLSEDDSRSVSESAIEALAESRFSQTPPRPKPVPDGTPATPSDEPILGEAPVHTIARQPPDYADFGPRLVAYTIDGLILTIGSVPLMLLFAETFVGVIVSLLTLVLVGSWSFNTLGWSFGKGLVSLRIRKIATGTRPGITAGLIRTLVSLLSVALLFIGYLWMIWDDENQTLHDKVAGTHVVWKR